MFTKSWYTTQYLWKLFWLVWWQKPNWKHGKCVNIYNLNMKIKQNGGSECAVESAECCYNGRDCCPRTHTSRGGLLNPRARGTPCHQSRPWEALTELREVPGPECLPTHNLLQNLGLHSQRLTRLGFLPSGLLLKCKYL